MTDRTHPEAGSTHIIRYALELGLLWIDGDGRDKVREALTALDALEAKLASIRAGGVQALSAAPEAIAKLRHLYQNMVNGAVRDTASAKRIAEGLLAPAIEALERATPPAEQQAKDSYIKLLADCRDAFPVPEHGSPIENEWIAAVGSHEAVPAYLQAVAKQQAAQKAAAGEPTGKQSLQVQVWVLPNGKGGGQFSWEPQDERFWTKLAPQQAAPKAAPGEQNAVSAEWLEQAYREGWAACRDAETIGEEAEDWAFGNSTANSRMIDAQQAAPQPAPAPLSDDTERLEWLLWKLPGDALRYVVGELSDTSSGAEFRAAIDAAIAAQGGKV